MYRKNDDKRNSDGKGLKEPIISCWDGERKSHARPTGGSALVNTIQGQSFIFSSVDIQFVTKEANDRTNRMF